VSKKVHIERIEDLRGLEVSCQGGSRLGLTTTGNIQGTFREHPVNIQGTFGAHSGNITSPNLTKMNAQSFQVILNLTTEFGQTGLLSSSSLVETFKLTRSPTETLYSTCEV
jgi:hypothetical protein